MSVRVRATWTPDGLRDAFAVGHQTIGDLLAIGNGISHTLGQRVVHAGFAALLTVVAGFAGEGRQKTKQRIKMGRKFEA